MAAAKTSYCPHILEKTCSAYFSCACQKHTWIKQADNITPLQCVQNVKDRKAPQPHFSARLLPYLLLVGNPSNDVRVPYLFAHRDRHARVPDDPLLAQVLLSLRGEMGRSTRRDRHMRKETRPDGTWACKKHKARDRASPRSLLGCCWSLSTWQTARALHMQQTASQWLHSSHVTALHGSSVAKVSDS